MSGDRSPTAADPTHPRKALWLPRIFIPSFMDRIACRVGIWALRRIYGADCETDVRDDWPGENLNCISCDAKRLVASMQEILQDG